MLDPAPPPASTWATSGALALTGPASGPPLVAPDPVVERITALGTAAGTDGLARLSERAAVAGLERRGSTSAGGACRLLRAADGWVAVSLPRPDDIALVPAWLGVGAVGADEAWTVVADAVARRCAAEVVTAAVPLGLAVGAVGEVAAGPGAPSGVVAHDLGPATPAAGDAPLVVDLSSLWAGPLCARLLADAGARVVKVESTSRPDGARSGPAATLDRLHHGARSVALDLDTPDGRRRLAALVTAADVVVEGSRPRALRHMGIHADALVAAGLPQVWVSITGHGRDAGNGLRVGFGDDAAAAGGLVAGTPDGPCFVADAVADPLAGMAAASATLDLLRRGRRAVLDVALARVAAHVAGPGAPGTGWRPWAGPVPPLPVPPPAPGPAAVLGAHTDAVLGELGIG